MRWLEHALCAGNIPKQLIYREAILRRSPLFFKFCGKPAYRRPSVLCGIEHGNTELAPCYRARETGKRTLCRMNLPSINLTVNLRHLRQNAKESAKKHILPVLNALCHRSIIQSHASFASNSFAYFLII